MRPSPRPFSLASLAVGAALVAAACSSAASTPTAPVTGATTGPTSAGAVASLTLGVTNDPALGAYLTGQGGMTLYILKTDTPDTSTCSGTCATNWPPLMVGSGATITGPSGATGTFATINRPDGTVQATYDHQPLYYFAGDSAAGDTKGQGKNNVWFVAPLTASGAGATTTPAATPAAPAVSYGY
jgi:predicted lipoprotein with Yx(FWY)xxD motif